VSFGPGGAEFITFGVPLPGPVLKAGSASVVGLPLAPASAAEALAALGLSDVVALSILLTSACVAGGGAVAALLEALGFIKKYSLP
jgi:hypothetical protein